MEPFLKQLVRDIQLNWTGEIRELCFVLPNRRAGLFLKKYLAESTDKPLLAPAIFSMEEFAERLSGVDILEPVTALFEFYNHFQAAEGEEATPLDEFVRWAPQLMNDFHEVDLHLLRADKLFQYVNETRALELWSVDGSELSDTQKKYLQFWESMHKYYTSFTTTLKSREQAYAGLAFRWAAERVTELQESGDLSAKSYGWSRIVFAGFNALSPAEERIIRSFRKAGQADIYWDTDEYYLANNQQEAGQFFRQYREGWAAGKFNWIFNDLKTRSRDIELIGVASHVGQAKVAGNILADMQTPGADTAIVLIQEALLIPMLQSMPREVGQVNVTMGYPLKHAPLHGFLNTVFLLQENGERMGIRKGEIHFYYKDLIKVLSHTFLQHVEGMDGLSDALISGIRHRNRVFIPVRELVELAGDAHAQPLDVILPLFDRWENEPLRALETFRVIFENLRGEMHTDDPVEAKEGEIELEYLYLYTKILKRLEALIGSYRSIRSLRTLRVVFNQLIGAQSIPFYGEPLRGLQVMGLLETRLLDFKNVIVLSANEDKLPQGKSTQSFIPYDIRKEFGLPTHRERDGMAAYHLYRLLQRAEKVHLLYNTEPDELGGGERSRFLTQIGLELPKANPNTTVTERIITMPVIHEGGNPTQIQKSEDVIAGLDALMQKGLSPSALNKFIQCPLDFYYKYLIGLRDEEEVEETIEATTLGSFVHTVLEKFYTPYIGKVLEAQAVRDMDKLVDEYTRREFLEKFRKSDLERGKNLLTLRVAIKFVRNFLKLEAREIDKLNRKGEQLEIVSLEQKLEKTVQVGDRSIKLIGLADRVDRIGSHTRIIDYKTGVVNRPELNVSDFGKLATDPKGAKAFQLLTYALLHAESGLHDGEVSSGIISFRKLSEGLMGVKVNKSDRINAQVLDDFEGLIRSIVTRIYDPAEPFQHQPEATYCSFCGE